MENKNVYIFYCSIGGGHYLAAKAIEEYLLKKGNVNVFLVDVLKYVDKAMNYINQSVYNFSVTHVPALWNQMYINSEEGVITELLKMQQGIYSKKLMKLFNQNNPDYIINTHFYGSIMCSKLKEQKKIKAHITTILTDFETHNMWYTSNYGIDRYIVSTSDMKSEMVKYGISEEKISVLGIPIRPQFTESITDESKLEVMKKYQINPDMKNILFFLGGKNGNSSDELITFAKKLSNELLDYQIICITGNNKKNYEKLKDLKLKNVVVLGFVTEVAILMDISEFVISKPRRTYNF